MPPLTCLHIFGDCQLLAHQVRRQGARLLDDLKATENITLGISERLALFLDNIFSNALLVLADQVLQIHHDSLTGQDGRLAPFLCSRDGRFGSFSQFFLGGFRHHAQEFLRGLNLIMSALMFF